jgi:hypothetical protein
VKLIAHSEPRDQLLSVPLVRVRRTATSGFELDDSFVPPCLAIEASPILHQRLRQLVDALQAKVNALYGFHREPSKNIIEFRSGDIASFWLLHTANAAFATLAHLHQHAALHPERLFQELLRLAGQLMTFSKGYTLADLPVYRHDDPGPSFARLDLMLRELLDTVISTRYFAITLDEVRPSFHLGRLDSGKIDDKTEFYLAVSADMPNVELIDAVPARFKVGAPDDVDKLVLSAMPGVRLSTCRRCRPRFRCARCVLLPARLARRAVRAHAAGAVGDDLCADWHQRPEIRTDRGHIMSYAPSLFGDNAPARCIPASTDAAFQARSLLDLLYDGFFMLFLLKNGRAPDSASEFSTKIQEFLSDFERGAKS